MEDEFNIQKSINGLWQKLAEWLDSIILALPNFILAILVFAIFIIASKYIGKVVGKLLFFKVRQD
ncbi:MAG: mechanosensitive ion channel family protein, partial [Candidatus Bathyarchaeota archaeon]|nr:mechanosensitive ion channel family protein [Candidatus Bathyarchaeota archaeon]